MEKVNPKIYQLAKFILGSEINEAINMIELFNSGGKQRKEVINKLSTLLKPPPKRPLYYCEAEVSHLSRTTRSLMRYLGDFVDLLAKKWLQEVKKLNYELRTPLGRTARQLEVLFPNKLLPKKLLAYNEIIYVNAKHNFDVPSNRKHLFTPQEGIMVIFITLRLAREIRAESKLANEYCKDI